MDAYQETTLEPCPGCARQKLSHLVVCGICWQALPSALKRDWKRAHTPDEKRAVARVILEHVRARRVSQETEA